MIGQQTLFKPPYKYVIDTCSILSQKPGEPHRRSVYSSLWERIDELIHEQIIVTCSEIQDEIEDPPIQKWLCDERCVILEIDDEIQKNVIRIVNEYPQLIDFKNTKSSADAFLIASAMKHDLVIITEESKASIKKIPCVCGHYGITCVNLTELAEVENWHF